MKMRKWKRLCLAAVTVSTMVLGAYLAAQLARADVASVPVTSSNVVLAGAKPGMSGDMIAQPVNMPSNPQQAAMVARGRYLAVAADCQQCHSVAGLPAYAGGLAMDSPIGAVYTPNITPSKTYGIGNYTDQQFWNVIHNGIAPGHSLLVFPKYIYPSMPYDAYSKLSYSDVMALKAYLFSLAPAQIPNQRNQIPFPLNIRAPLLGWRLLFFHPQPVQYDPGWSPSVRNGAFLVQALAHCSDCHTPRNIFLASDNTHFLAGGHIPSQSWYAPDITSSQQDGVGGWQSATLAQYLAGAGGIGPGSPFGPMKQVVDDSLSRLPASDVQDIVAYLQTATKPQQNAPQTAADMPMTDLGARLYQANCALCHGANGEGVTNNFPNLAGNQAISGGPSNDVIAMLLGGFDPWHPEQSAMPAFRATMSDDQIAAVTNYVRTAWGNHGTADATGEKVAGLRASTANVVWLDTATVQARLGAAMFDDISGSFSRDGDGLNCQLDLHLATANPADSVAIGGVCGAQGSNIEGQATMTGKTMPVTLRLGNIASGSSLRAVTISGNLGGQTLHAQIAMVPANG